MQIDPIILGKIEAYCYMVSRGKPAAMLPIQDRFVEEALSFVGTNYGLKMHVEELSEGWKVLWLYKYSHLLEVIKALPQAPKTCFDHWILGKLFGYEEAAIHEFLAAKFDHIPCDNI